MTCYLLPWAVSQNDVHNSHCVRILEQVACQVFNPLVCSILQCICICSSVSLQLSKYSIKICRAWIKLSVWLNQTWIVSTSFWWLQFHSSALTSILVTTNLSLHCYLNFILWLLLFLAQLCYETGFPFVAAAAFSWCITSQGYLWDWCRTVVRLLLVYHVSGIFMRLT